MEEDMAMRLTRRSFVLAGSAALAAPAIVRAQAREIVVGGPAGMADLVRSEVVPAWERRTGAHIAYEGSRSVVNLQKLQTQRAQPQMSVVIMDEDIMLTAAGDNLLEAVTPANVPEMARIVPAAIARDGLWLRYKTPRIATAYNTQRVEGGIASWADLWTPRFARKLMVPHFSLTSAVALLTVAAHLETGKPYQDAQYDADAGFRKLRQIKPNVLGFHNTGQQAQTLLEQGEAWGIPGEISSYVLLRKSEGVPVDLNRPSEGSFSLPSCVALVKGGPNAELARDFINEMLSVRVQELWASKLFDSPANPNAHVSPDILSPAQMFNTDWEFVARNRAQWIERFDREIVA
jgi:putative spermidine/putrescine transport system substrate-binding protein